MKWHTKDCFNNLSAENNHNYRKMIEMSKKLFHLPNAFDKRVFM